MRGRTHVAGGLAVYGALALLGVFSFTVWAIIAVVFGALLPDMLEPAVDYTHRKFFHSWLFLIVVIVAGFVLKLFGGFVGSLIALACLGYAVHLLMDSRTPMGLPDK